MFKVQLSVMMEFSEDWLQRVAEFQKALRNAKLVNAQGEVRVQDYAALDRIFELARKFELMICIHS